ncbi:MAG: amidohydrolase [Gammaproteobacteria bacterium TMED163]|nr:MAG: amidohydrolase [Gammaproteobacteria bacterium TMED163]HAO87986.1 amidohydrolase [Gammaproteobacteria bacterium]|tara:strand:+ start:17800 stop:19449 length:1650 start_codon:yes stop_codon:yes gene_type:complete
MRKTTSALLGLLSFSAFADTTLYTNVNGYTLNSDYELLRFNAIQFTDDRVDAIFGEGEELPDDASKVIDGGGQTMIPGLVDAHGHVLTYGLGLLRVDLVGATTEAEAAQRVLDFAADNTELEWVQGRGWNQVLWDSNEFPTAASLDALVGDRPVWLTRVDGHAAWANTMAMELAGINQDTEDPVGGQIIRDENGNATGVFVDTAMSYIREQIPDTSFEEQKVALIAAMKSLATYGITSVHDAGIGSSTISAYKELVEDAPLPIRVYAMIAASDPLYQDRLEEGFIESDDLTFAIESVKVVADGALGSRGAALIEDYHDDPGNRGLLRYNDERLEFLMRAAMNAGFQVNTHAIGDDANMRALDNYEQLILETNSRDRRHRVEHAQILRYEDILRFAELGVVPSMQATHATSDKNMAEDRLGPVRIQGAYAWRKLLETGARIANGSDFPVEHPNPFYGLHASVTRQDQRNEPPGGWYAEENMSLVEALASFTIDAAYAGHQEGELGSLEPGKKADFIILDRDIFVVSPTELWQTQVYETWVNGVKITDKNN